MTITCFERYSFLAQNVAVQPDLDGSGKDNKQTSRVIFLGNFVFSGKDKKQRSRVGAVLNRDGHSVSFFVVDKFGLCVLTPNLIMVLILIFYPYFFFFTILDTF